MGGFALMVKSGLALIVKVTVAERANDPAVPVIVTLKFPAVDPVQESVEVAEPTKLKLVGLTVQVRLDEDGDDVRFTVPENWFREVSVTVEFAGEPTAAATLVGLAATVKSGVGVTESVITTVWDTAPLVPVTFTL